MAPHQNTFSIISNGGPAPVAPKPPMTSKQAQKLYRQANKLPKRTKAEQRKWEKEQQEEIRKEFEKERAAVKAKAARERKKAKEDEARENRRRNGQPLIDCRPSQDTIARFIRGNGTNRKRNSSGESVSENDGDSATSPVIKPSSPTTGCAKANTSLLSPRQSTSKDNEKDAVSMPPPPRPSQKSRPSQCQASTGNFIAPSPASKAAAPMQSLRPPVFKAPVIKPLQTRSAAPVIMDPPPRPPPKSKSKSKPFMMPKLNLPILPPARQQSVKQEKEAEAKPAPPQRPFTEDLVERKSKISHGQLKLPLEQSPVSPPSRLLLQMPPPQLPRSQMPKQQNPLPQMPLPQMPSPQIPSPQVPPMSTQAIIEDCFDDFFPTASQLALELEDDFDDSSKRSFQPFKETASHNKPTAPGQGEAMGKGAEKTTPKSERVHTNGLQRPSGSKPTRQPLGVRPNATSNISKTKMLPTAKRYEIPGHQQETRYDNLHPTNEANAVQTWDHPATRNAATTPNTRMKTHTNHIQQRPHVPQGYKETNSSIFKENNNKNSHNNNWASGPKPATATKPLFDDFFPLICTQDLMMSSQELQEIESPAKTEIDSETSSGGRASHPSPLIEMDLAAIDWDDDLDDF